MLTGTVGTVEVTLHDETGAVVLHATADGPTVRTRLEGVRRWSPDDPHRHALRIGVRDTDGNLADEVHGHVGFRTVEVRDGHWWLNGERLYQRLLLDQGYWPDTGMTPPSAAALRDDLRFVRDAGFDGVRKHQKLEDPRFLDEADRLGLLVWVELPSPGNHALVEGSLEADLLREWREAVVRDRNHPSVVCWVPFNESWGIRDVTVSPDRQATVRRIVDATRSLDPTRPVCDNSGWGHVCGDVVDVHDYASDPAALAAAWRGARGRGFERVGSVGLEPEALALLDLRKLAEYHGVERLRHLEPFVLMPDTTTCADPTAFADASMLLSELGGIGLAERPATAPTADDTFVYRTARSAAELLDRFTALVAAAASIEDFDGWCWTQLTDVEQETNGLLTADRRPKIAAADLRRAIRGA